MVCHQDSRAGREVPEARAAEEDRAARGKVPVCADQEGPEEREAKKEDPEVCRDVAFFGNDSYMT
jgi:hypothetical protein